MNDSKVTTPSAPSMQSPSATPTARSKVINMWSSSWKSMGVPKAPSMPIVETTPIRPAKGNKSDKNIAKETNKGSELKKLIPKENSVKTAAKHNKSDLKTIKTKDSKLKNTEPNRKELRTNGTKLNVTPKEDNRRDSTKGNNSETQSQDNPVLSKLRKRKIDSKSPQINSEAPKPLPNNTMTKITEDIEKTIKESAEDSSVKRVEDQSKNDDKQKESIPEKVVNDKTNSNDSSESGLAVEPMDVSVETDDQLCIGANCKRKISRFGLLENRFCSSDCAVKEWTIEFHKIWGTKKF